MKDLYLSLLIGGGDKVREIEFRVWNYDGYISLSEAMYKTEIVGVQMPKGSNMESFFDDVIIEQFTGLKDKNGKKIFEGDILREGNDNFSVLWYENMCGFSLKHDHQTIQYPGWNRGKQMEIIGNIHENPELL